MGNGLAEDLDGESSSRGDSSHVSDGPPGLKLVEVRDGVEEADQFVGKGGQSFFFFLSGVFGGKEDGLTELPRSCSR